MNGAIQMTADRDTLIASLAIAQDLILTMDSSALSPDDQAIVMAAKIIQEAIARKASASNAHTPDFRYTQVQAADMVSAAKGLKPDTFRANKPWNFLEQKGRGEGIGFETRGPRSRMYSEEAVNYLIAHWDRTRWAMG